MSQKRSPLGEAALVLALAASWTAADPPPPAQPRRAPPVLTDVKPPPPKRLPPARVRAGKPAEMLLDLKLPEGWRLDPATPLRWRFSETWAGFTFTKKRKDSLLAPKLPVRIPFRAVRAKVPGAGPDTGARLSVDFRYCRKSGAGDCRDGSADYLVVLEPDPEETRTQVPVTVTVDAP
jgi:hypothetical protein